MIRPNLKCVAGRPSAPAQKFTAAAVPNPTAARSVSPGFPRRHAGAATRARSRPPAAPCLPRRHSRSLPGPASRCFRPRPPARSRPPAAPGLPRRHSRSLPGPASRSSRPPAGAIRSALAVHRSARAIRSAVDVRSALAVHRSARAVHSALAVRVRGPLRPAPLKASASAPTTCTARRSRATSAGRRRCTRQEVCSRLCGSTPCLLGHWNRDCLFSPAMQGARVNLKGWQQAAVAFGSAFGALLDPRRADLIAALGETTGKPAFQRVLQQMKNSAEGRKILLERPRVISTQVSHAWDMPQNTFGAAYAQFMGSRNFSPDDRPPVRFMDTDELTYVATRAREVHDFWHVLFGLPTDLIGETALKVIEFEQMFLPMCMLSVVGGSARFSEKQRTLFFQHFFPWATKAGLKCTNLMSVYCEKHFHEDLEEVRRNWGIVPCPDPKQSSV